MAVIQGNYPTRLYPNVKLPNETLRIRQWTSVSPICQLVSSITSVLRPMPARSGGFAASA